MVRTIHIALITVALVLSIVLAGCESKEYAEAKRDAGVVQPTDAAASLGSILREISSAPASPEVSEFLRPLSKLGYLFFILAIPCVFTRSWVSAGVMVAIGVGINVLGSWLIGFSWSVMLFIALFVGVALYLAVDAWRAKRGKARVEAALDVEAEVIENEPEGRAIKDGVIKRGPKAVAIVKPVISAAKNRLKAAGKIKA